MKNIEHTIIAYFNGELTTVEIESLIEERKKSAEINQLFLSYRSIENDINNSQEERPSNKLSKNFYTHLESLGKQEKDNTPSAKVFTLKSIMKYAAASIVLFAAGLTLYNNFNINDDKNSQIAFNEFLSDMESKSDTEKIKAIYVNHKPNQSNQSKIKEILISSLRNDKSSNVRLASVETLAEYLDDEMVRSVLIRSLGTEEDPQVQVAIIMALSASKDKEAIKPLEQLINKEGGSKFVKDEAHVGIMNLTSI